MAAVPEGTIDDVLAWVGDDPERAIAAYEAEVAGKGRSTLLKALDDEFKVVDSGETESDAAVPEEVEPEPEAPAGEKKYRALKRMHAQGVIYKPGDIVGPAPTWSRVEGYVRAGWLEEV